MTPLFFNGSLTFLGKFRVRMGNALLSHENGNGREKTGANAHSGWNLRAGHF